MITNNWMMKITLLYVLLSLAPIAVQAQGYEERDARHDLTSGLTYRVEAQVSASDGRTPLWLNANKYGLSSLDQYNGYFRASAIRPLREDSLRRWGIGYGLDLAVASHYTSKVMAQQAFVEARWLHGALTVGSKEYPMELKNNRLSSGSQTLGINARPIPQMRLALPDYWQVFGLRWLGLKGHVAYGIMADNDFQDDFTHNTSRAHNRLYHSKAGYLRIGNPYSFRPLSLEVGLEMASMFGGQIYTWRDGAYTKVEGDNSLRAFWNALMPGGSDVGENKYKNVEGDMVGSWVGRINYDADTWSWHFYGDKFFEDHSGMFQLDYNGYGEGEEWNQKKQSRYLVYELKDWMLGTEIDWHYGTWLRSIVLEYLYTKYQSGPIYHDHTENISDHIGGGDDYYNHGLYVSWQYFGQVIGNPLYRSPIYNTDGTLTVEDNRFVAYHLGISGQPTPRLSYRLMATYQSGLGTYKKPYTHERHNVSCMLEAAYSLPHGWLLTGAFGMDAGSILGHNYGLQITVAKTGWLGRK